VKALVVDDEAPARERLKMLLAAIDDVDVTGESSSGVAALELAARLAPDVVLLDIRMPGMDGLETARHLRGFEAPPAIVFCTAFDEHALAAFDADATDYLVKPIRAERLEAALAKVRRRSGAAPRGSGAVPAPRSHLCARVRGNLVLVPLDAVDCLMADDRYVTVRHAGGELLIEEPLKALEQEFGERFVRIHRNCLVARARLASLERAGDGRVLVRLAGRDEPLEVSRRNLPALRRLVRGL
jgi:two-component system response regulator AlgR